MLPPLAFLFGEPKSSGDLRTHMTDFKVYEQIPFTFSGEGEHLLIKVRKTGLNTTFVAHQLAKYFSVKDNLVTYAGLKDRFAVTEQWFGVHLPGKSIDDLSDFSIEGIEILAYQRHNKKLRTGALSGNRFEISLRNVTDIHDVVRRWYAVCEFGVPNYFGEQRFGINGGNIDRAKELFAGRKVRDKKKRSIYLSAARSLLFNHIVSQRIETNLFDTIQSGDVLMLAGTQSVFPVETLDETLKQRLLDKDVDITAPLWGRGKLMSTSNPYDLEHSLIEAFPDICTGLENVGLKQERRRIRLTLSDTTIDTDESNKQVDLSFSLPAGCFATTILREIVNYQDLTVRHNPTAG